MKKSANLEHQTFTLKDGRVLGFGECGDLKGKPVFYFHGWPGSRLRMKSIADAAKKAHAHVISLDRPGYGLSHYKSDRTLLDWPDDVLELADHLKIKKFAIQGVSGGGPYAAVCAYKIPQRLTKVGIVVGLGPTYIPGIFGKMPLRNKAAWANYARVPLLADFGAKIHEVALKKFHRAWNPFLIKADRIAIQGMADEARIGLMEAFRNGHKGPALDLLLYTNHWGFDVKDIKTKVYLWYGGG